MLRLFVTLLVLTPAIALAQEDIGNVSTWKDVLAYWVNLVSQFTMVLVLLATLIVRVTPSKKDDTALMKIWERVQKIMQYLPTFGLNPKTQELLTALQTLQKENEEKVSKR